MIAPRVSIGRMMLMIVPVAVGCAALCRPTQLGASLTFSVVFAILTVKTIGVAFGEAGRRPSRAGFAVAGWLCLLLHFGRLFDLPNGSPIEFGISAPTTPVKFVLDLLFPRIVPGANVPPRNPYTTFPPAPAPLPPDAIPRETPPTTMPEAPPRGIGPGATPDVLLTHPDLSPLPPPAPPSFWTRWTSIELGVFGDTVPRSPSFLTIGYSLASLLAAGLGSLVANYYAARKLKASSEVKHP